MGELIGLVISDSMSDEEIIQEAISSEENKTVSFFKLADAARAIRARHGEKSAKIEELARAVGKEPSTVGMYASWGSIYSFEERDKRLTTGDYRRMAEVGDTRAARQLARWAIGQKNEGVYEHGVMLRKRDDIKDALPCSDGDIERILDTFGPAPTPKPKPFSKEDFTFKEVLTSSSDVEPAIATLTIAVVNEWKRLLDSGIDITSVRLRLHSEFWGGSNEQT